MPEEKNFKSVEKTLKKSQELMDKILEQNKMWPGAGVFEKDVRTARSLLPKMEKALSDVIVMLLQRINDLPGQDLETEVSQAIHKAYNLMSHLYDDIRAVQTTLEKGQSQSDAIKQTGIHLQQITQHCHQVQNHFLEVVRMTRTERRRDT